MQRTEAAGATRVRHDGVEDSSSGGGFVIAAEILAGRQGARLFHPSAGREIEEVESVRAGGGKNTGAELGMDKFLNRGIGDRFTRVVRGERGGADALAVTNGFAGDAVFGELVDEELVRMKSKKELTSPGRMSFAGSCQALPQKTVKTSTLVRSGPLR